MTEHHDLETRLSAALAAQARAGELFCSQPSSAVATTRPANVANTRPRRRLVTVTAALTGIAAAGAMVVTLTVFDRGTAPSAAHRPAPAMRTHPDATSAVSRHVTRRPTQALPSIRSHPATAADPAARLRAPAGRIRLGELAARRARVALPRLGVGQYEHQRRVSAGPIAVGADGSTIPAPAGTYTLDETWSTQDSSTPWVRLQRTVGDGTVSVDGRWSGVCGDFYQDTQDPPVGKGCTRPGDFGDPSPRFLAGLPRDPAQLYALIRSDAQAQVNPEKVHDVGQLMMMTIDDLLSAPRLPSDLAAATTRVLAEIDGAQVYDGVTTFTGRRGVGVAYTVVSGRADTLGVVLDPQTGAYEGDFTGKPDTPAYAATDLTTDVVDSVPAARPTSH